MKKIGVLGTGTMGAGIIQVLAQNGYEVVLRARRQESVDKGLATVTKNRDKHLYIFELTICRVYNRQLLSCKINIHLVSGNLLYVK